MLIAFNVICQTVLILIKVKCKSLHTNDTGRCPYFAQRKHEVFRSLDSYPQTHDLRSPFEYAEIWLIDSMLICYFWKINILENGLSFSSSVLGDSGSKAEVSWTFWLVSI